MRRSSESGQRTQTTVAELLARCGDAAPASGRRRRRAEPELSTAEDTVATPILPPSVPPTPAPETPAAKRKLSSLPNWAPAVGSGAGPSPGPGKPVMASSPVATRSAPLAARAAALDGPATEQLPRYTSAPAPRPDRAPESSQPPAGLGTSTRVIPERNGTPATEDEPETEADEPQPYAPWWEWAVMVSQVGLGVVGGATLWLICEWLWQRIPVVALVVALAVITGLVWVVRRVRRAEDLQTTVMAVLVGLFVTVSPAALLLVGR
ncbi:MAG TPA: hypothetical protein VFO16_11760 [Pseudonocardiaceae bacterium]|nr:hypothetical protein [Pseudonocardiaceae bacterium]